MLVYFSTMCPHVPYVLTKFRFKIHLVYSEIKKTNLTRR
jgi:hypothetical protein